MPLSAGNAKLGPGIHSWSLPADKNTCPGATKACSAARYAKKGRFVQYRLSDVYRKNKILSFSRQFVDWMVAEIRRLDVRILRIHVSGDFYSVAYTRKWIEICKKCPHVKFFAYTRSWRKKRLLPVLRELGNLRNMTLWWSTDRETGPAPVSDKIRSAFMAQDDEDAPGAPNTVSLVFRVKRGTPVKQTLTGILVCPAENGHQGRRRVTCDKCKLCFAPNAAGKRRLNNR